MNMRRVEGHLAPSVYCFYFTAFLVLDLLLYYIVWLMVHVFVGSIKSLEVLNQPIPRADLRQSGGWFSNQLLLCCMFNSTLCKNRVDRLKECITACRVYYYLRIFCSAAHHLTVRRLAFRPKVGAAGPSNDSNTLQLASCAEDHHVKVYNITLPRTTLVLWKYVSTVYDTLGNLFTYSSPWFA